MDEARGGPAETRGGMDEARGGPAEARGGPAEARGGPGYMELYFLVSILLNGGDIKEGDIQRFHTSHECVPGCAECVPWCVRKTAIN